MGVDRRWACWWRRSVALLVRGLSARTMLGGANSEQLEITGGAQIWPPVSFAWGLLVPVFGVLSVSWESWRDLVELASDLYEDGGGPSGTHMQLWSFRPTHWSFPKQRVPCIHVICILTSSCTHFRFLKCWALLRLRICIIHSCKIAGKGCITFLFWLMVLLE